MLYPSQIPDAPQLDCLGCTKAGKCCDFQPFIPNFTLGALLHAGFTMKDFIGEHPLQAIGLIPAASFRKRHQLADAGARGPDLYCQFFNGENGTCRIWEFRPGECRTYFCEGRKDSHVDLSQELFQLESRLAQMALLQLGFSASEVHRQVDVLNLEADPIDSDLRHLEFIYRFAGEWASQVDANRVREWS